MTVGLTKDPIEKLPEYTPVHLIDEEDAIVRTSMQESAQSQEEHLEDSELTEEKHKDLMKIEIANNETQKMFQKEFLPAAKKASKSAQLQNQITGAALRRSLPNFFAGALGMIIAFCFPEQIA